MRVAKVTAGGPADKAGIETGDVIVRFGETPVHSVRDYMVGLQNATGDKPVPVQIKRGEKTLTVMVEPTGISHSAH
jgi:S1-C subfamily serine protease